MELKYDPTEHTDYKMPVLIVPLWNWNTTFRMMFNAPFCFNRTFMELKFENVVSSFVLFISFNRTFMELKLKSAQRIQNHVAF